MRTAIRGMLGIALASIGTGALAQSLAWQITEVSGDVVIRHGNAQRAATRGATLQPGDAVMTGAQGRAVMVHEKDFVTLASRSRATVPGATEQATRFTKLLQDLGNAVYKIEKRGVPHFGVTTPYLAAVVKGTTFSITVDDKGSALQVVEGAVEVATPDGGARDLILPGGVASVGAQDRFRLTVHGDSDRVIDSPARAPGTTAGVVPASGTVDAGTSSAPAGSSAAAASTVAGTADAALGIADTIMTPVAARPIDLAAMSGGLVSGNAGFTGLTGTVTQSVVAAKANQAAIAAPAPAGAETATPVIAATAAVSPAAPSSAPPSSMVSPPVTVATTVAAPDTMPSATTAPVTVSGATPATTPVPTTPVSTTPVTVTPVATTPVTTTPVPTPLPPAPVTTTPVTTQPIGTSTPVASSPIVTTPVTVATQPVTTTPVTTTPVTTTPIVTTPVTAQTPPVPTPVKPTPVATGSPIIGIIGTVISAGGSLLDDSGKGNNGHHYGQYK